MTNPLVSIITPSFNQGSFIRDCVESIASQSYSPIEHIVIDGGSTDETLAVLKAYEGMYDLRWISESDGGMYEAINKGLRMARGEVLAYLNCDDLYFPWSVEVAVQALEGRPDVSFVYGDLLNIDDRSQTGMLVFYPPFNQGFLKRYGVIGQPTVFWRRSAHEALGGFDEDLQYVADCDYWMRASDSHRLLKLREFLAIDRNQSASKRMSQAAKVRAELNQLRHRYVHPAGPARLQLVADRTYNFVWRRINLLLFLAEAGKARVGIRPGAWRRFITHDHATLRLGHTARAVIPRLGDHSMATFDYESAASSVARASVRPYLEREVG